MEAASIILKVWNASQHVKVCLEGLLQNTPTPFELILVDNGSKPKLRAYLTRLAESDDRIQLILNEANYGPGFANRQGVEQAAHRLVCLMDSDVLVPPGWLERLVSDFHQVPGLKILTPLQPEEGVHYPFESQSPDSRQAWYEVKRNHPQASPLEQLKVYAQGLNLADLELEMRKANPAGIRFTQAPPDFLSSSCMLVDREFIDQVGGFADPMFRGYGSEDVDLCWRVGAAGGLLGKTGSVYVHHFFGASLDSNTIDRQAALRRSNMLLYDKWKEHLIALVAGQAHQDLDSLVAYLERHFIFSALARNTRFIDDLRLALGNPGIPDDIEWRPS